MYILYDYSQNLQIIFFKVATQDLRIWHAFFGMPGSCNDINVLDRSPLLFDYLRSPGQNINFKINGHEYHQAYFLVDGIYPPWANFVQTLSHPQGQKRCYFAKMQEAARKDVERCFGVLQARFSIIKQPCRLWCADTMKSVMKACITLHNMIIEDDIAQGVVLTDVDGYEEAPEVITSYNPQLGELSIDNFCNLFHGINDLNAHRQLQDDLIEHLWFRKGNM